MPTRGEPFALDPARSALLVVDMQNDFVREGAPQEVPQARLVTGTMMMSFWVVPAEWPA